MTCNLPPKVARARGMSLLELALCITVLTLLVILLFLGSRAWKQGDDRAGCVLTLRNVQVAARSYQNLYRYPFGGSPRMENGSRDIALQLYQKGYIEKELYDRATGNSTCPSGGSYLCPEPEVFPERGRLFLKCSLADQNDHQPDYHADW